MDDELRAEHILRAKQTLRAKITGRQHVREIENEVLEVDHFYQTAREIYKETEGPDMNENQMLAVSIAAYLGSKLDKLTR